MTPSDGITDGASITAPTKIEGEDSGDDDCDGMPDRHGDLNFNGVRDGGDLGHLPANWREPTGDLSGDGTTDGGDLGYWGPWP